jgi:hypothetical protein
LVLEQTRHAGRKFDAVINDLESEDDVEFEEQLRKLKYDVSLDGSRSYAENREVRQACKTVMTARQLLREELKNMNKGSRRWQVLDHQLTILCAESEWLSNTIAEEIQAFLIIRRERKGAFKKYHGASSKEGRRPTPRIKCQEIEPCELTGMLRRGNI